MRRLLLIAGLFPLVFIACAGAPTLAPEFVDPLPEPTTPIAPPEAPSPPAPPPSTWNIIIITADTLRGDMLPANGNTQITTPHLDTLAASGVNFTRAYTNITTTLPAHASLLTSLYPQDHKAYDNVSAISEDIVTLPEILSSSGWHTAAIVNMPWLNPEVSRVPQGIVELARGDRIRKADETTTWALDFLKRQQEDNNAKPYFLWLHYVDNHTPYHAPGEYATQYYPSDRDPKAGQRGTLQDVWPLFPKDHRDNDSMKRWLKGVTDAEYVVAGYKGSVSWLDHHIGKIIEQLNTDGTFKRTLFLFTSDHGESLGEHDLWFCHGGLYEPTTRIPLMMHIPGLTGGQEVSSIVDLVDVMPTILQLLELPLSEHLRGDDLTPQLHGETVQGSAALLEHTGRQIVGVVTERYKYIEHLKTRRIYPGYPMNKGTIELFDLKTDPGETTNIAKENPELVRTLQAKVKELQSKQQQFEHKAADVDESTKEALRALGYLQ